MSTRHLGRIFGWNLKAWDTQRLCPRLTPRIFTYPKLECAVTRSASIANLQRRLVLTLPTLPLTGPISLRHTVDVQAPALRISFIQKKLRCSTKSDAT